MRKIKLDNDLIRPSEIKGLCWPDNYSLKGKLKKKTKVGAVLVKEGKILDYKKCINSEHPRVYTVEQCTEDSFRLFQVGTYENPIIFRMDGVAPTKWTGIRSWNDYRIVVLGGN